MAYMPSFSWNENQNLKTEIPIIYIAALSVMCPVTFRRVFIVVLLCGSFFHPISPAVLSLEYFMNPNYYLFMK